MHHNRSIFSMCKRNGLGYRLYGPSTLTLMLSLLFKELSFIFYLFLLPGETVIRICGFKGLSGFALNQI